MINENEILYNITVYHGEDYQLDLQLIGDNEEPVSFVGWTVEATLREFPESHDGVDFYSLSNHDGISLMLSKTQTESIGYSQGKYDVFVTDLDRNRRVKLLSGQAEIIHSSTR